MMFSLAWGQWFEASKHILHCGKTRFVTFCANSETVELVCVEDLGITKFLGLKFDSDLTGKNCMMCMLCCDEVSLMKTDNLK